MSRARNWLKKVKKTDKLGKSLSLKCRYCGMPIGKELYDMDKPWEYTCKICGKQPYIEKFYAKHPNVFIEHYFGIKLFRYQKIMLKMISKGHKIKQNIRRLK